MSQTAPVDEVSRPRRLGFLLYVLQLWTVWGIAVSNVFLGASTLWALFARRWRRVEWAPRAPALAWISALGVLFLVAVAFSYEPATSLTSIDDLTSLLPFVLTLVFVRSERDARAAVAGIVAMGAALATVGLIQLALSGGLDLNHRIAGPFSHYQTFAGVLLICDLLAIGRLLTARARERWLLVTSLVLINLALLANLTRGSWVALFASLLFLVAVLRPRYLLAAAPLLVAVSLLLPVPVARRLGSIFDLANGSNYDRLCMVYAGAHMVAERPVFGLGPKLVERRYPIYRHPTAPRDHRPHLHNSYLQVAAEQGLVTLFVFVAGLGASLLLYRRNYLSEGGARGPRVDLHLGGGAALVAYTLAALFEDNWTDTEVQRLALFIIALPFCLRQPVALTAEES